MTRVESRPHSAMRTDWGNRLVWGQIVLFTVLFAGLTFYRISCRDRSEVNADKLQELNSATAPPAVTLPAAADWPWWRGPNHDGASTETGLCDTWPTAGPAVLWAQATGDGYSSVVIAQARAVTMVQDGEDEAIVCWDAATGTELWRFRYPAHFRHRQFGDGPRSTPAIALDRVYAVGATGILHCLKLFPNTAAGEVVWRKDLLAEFDAPQPMQGVVFSPLVENGLVHVMPGGAAGKTLAALDSATGAVVWQAFADGASYSSPIATDLAGRRQVVYLLPDRLVGLTPETGRLLWEFPWSEGAAHSPSSIATPLPLHRASGDYLFVSSGYRKGCGLIKIERDGDGDRFRAGLVYKNLNMRTVFSSCVQSGDYIYGFDDISLACLDLRTGQRQWKERGFDKGSLTLADGHLIVLGADGTLALAAADPNQYRELGRFEHSRQFSSWTVPVVAGGRLYVRDRTRLVCYDLKKSPGG